MRRRNAISLTPTYGSTSLNVFFIKTQLICSLLQLTIIKVQRLPFFLKSFIATMFVLLCASLFGLSLAAKPPTQNPLYIVDPLNSPSHGVIFSSDHVVLKVDCPGCPVFDTAWDTKATSLV